MNTSSEHRDAQRPLRFLRWFCPPELYEGIEGDLLENYEEDLKAFGKVSAKRKLWLNVARFFRLSIIIRNSFSFNLMNTIMLRNYLIIAYRNIARNKIFAMINILGLGTGLATCFLIFQFVSFEFSYDTFNEKLDRTYRVTNDRFQNGKLIQHGTIMYPTIGPTIARDYAEVEAYTRLMPGGSLNIKIGDKIFRGDECHFADEHFFSVFDYKWLTGDRRTSLKERYSMVLTESIARKFFEVNDGDYASIIGRTLLWGQDKNPYTITGICEDIPSNSHIQFDVLVSYSTLFDVRNHDADDSWTWSDMRHYLVLKPGTDYKALEAKFPEFSERYFQGDKISGSVEKFYLQPLKDAHLYSDYEYDIAKRSSGRAVWAMLVVAVFVLLIAWINYINLTTSRALERAKEVGLRKVMGALKSQLVKQFIFESIIISAIAFIVASLAAVLLQSSFNAIVGTDLSMISTLKLTAPSTIITAGVVLVAGVMLSSFYPAFVLSSYQPVTVLKGKFQRSSGGSALRKFLVVFQFMASAALITSTVIVSKQLKFMSDSDLGINLDRTLVVRSPERTEFDTTFIARVNGFKNELMSDPDILGVASSGRLPGQRLGRAFNVKLATATSGEHYTMSTYGVDHDFFDVYKVPLLAGRKFLESDHHFDENEITNLVVNNKAAELLGFKDPSELVGQQVNAFGKDWNIIGVVGDFHQESFRAPMEPIIFYPVYGSYADLSIRLQSEKYESSIPGIKATFAKYFPDNAFDYFFIQDRYQSQNEDDVRFGKVITIFTGLAIIISCLGLIGLSSYMTTQRTKEIGIRKVLGASIRRVVLLLSADFVKLVLIAALLSLPLTFFSMQRWLSVFAYKIDLGWMLFILPVVIILFIASLTISFQVIRVALANPADTLKYE